MRSDDISARRLMLAGLIAVLAGCSSIDSQQEFAAKPNEVSIPNQWEASGEFVNHALTNQLLDLVNQPSLTRLVHESLAANYDLRVTAARLQQSRLLARQADLDKGPELSTTYTASRDDKGQITNSQSLSLDLSWEVDVWGRLADASDAAAATTKASKLDYLYAKNSLAARIIQAWLDISYRAQIIAVEEQWVTSLLNSEDIILEQVLDGVKEQADLDTAKASTEQTKASLVARKQAQVVAIRSLNVLRGYAGSELPDITFLGVEVKSPPAQVPGDMIGSRPDLIAAYQRIVAADKDTSVAYKELLPKFTLTASASKTGTPVDTSAWSLIGGITAPLFNRESLESSAKIKKLDAQVAYLNYQKLLINAMNEVENAFGEEVSLKAQELHLRKAYAYSTSSMNDYQNLYQDGVSDVLTLLSAKQTAFQAKIQLLETEQARLSNRITLGLALGMGV
ncbi:TolC family protein [Vibrio sp. JC009]|uniref:TolC family protein n=1 Tax=Vibrio sp. JC009 TaxID=2912314 RepID=UPI0023B09E51|nr:TolC family protein [Vibrio sp. JC009]WED23022.1 TolC family protein [Vibrio sp. JC009]